MNKYYVHKSVCYHSVIRRRQISSSKPSLSCLPQNSWSHPCFLNNMAPKTWLPTSLELFFITTVCFLPPKLHINPSKRPPLLCTQH